MYLGRVLQYMSPHPTTPPSEPSSPPVVNAVTISKERESTSFCNQRRHPSSWPPPAARPVRHRRRRRPMAVISDTNSSRGVFVVGGDATSITLSLVAIPAIVVFIWQRYQDTQAKHLSVASVSCFAVG